jgi:biotin carboxyl carrier protein
MPARVGSITVTTGARVRKGDILVVLEAMKMELPIRAPGAGVVAAVHCEQGQLVQADTVLLDLE